MSSESYDPTENDQERATAFVFGELDAARSAEFVQELRQSESLRSLVASIRDSVGVVEDELRQGADRLSSPARKKVLDAVMAQPASDRNSDRQALWNIALAVAASLLLVCGLALPALNRSLATNDAQAELQETLNDLQNKMDALADRNQLLQSQLASGGDNRLPNEPPIDDVVKDHSTDAGSGRVSRRDSEHVDQAIGSAEAMLADRSESESIEIVSTPPTGESTDDDIATRIDDQAAPVNERTDTKTDRVVDDIASGEMSEKFDRRVVRAQAKPMKKTSQPDSNSDLDDEAAFDLAMERAIDRPFGVVAIGKLPPLLNQLRNQYPAMSQRQFDEIAALLQRSIRDSNPFDSVHDNRFVVVDEYPLSQLKWTFGNGSFDRVRNRLMREQQFPMARDVRIEELVNFFSYSYPSPPPEQDLSASVDVADCPWNDAHRLARVVVQSRDPVKADLPQNLVFLLDLSGSMNRAKKLPVVLAGLKSIALELDSNDRLTILPFAGPKKPLLESTPGSETKKIIDAIDSVSTSRGTNGVDAFRQAFRIATAEAIDGGVNQVVFCGDEGFRLDPDEQSDFAKAAAAADRAGVKLTMMHFGDNNVALSPVEDYCLRAGGEFIAIDSEAQAINKLWNICGLLNESIALNPEIQVEFNPAEAEAYRLIGFENGLRIAGNSDEAETLTRSVSAGETLTCFYEFVPRERNDLPVVSESDAFPLKYQQRTRLTKEAEFGELLSVTIRYAQPRSKRPVTLEFSGRDEGQSFEDTDAEFRFAASVVAVGMLLRESPHSGDASFQWAESEARDSVGQDPSGYRGEWVRMIQRAREIAGR